MTIQVNSKLIKSKNPTEYGFKLGNQIGEIVHELDDGYNLIRFNHLKIKGLKRVNGIKTPMMICLEWYIHESDLKRL